MLPLRKVRLMMHVSDILGELRLTSLAIPIGLYFCPWYRADRLGRDLAMPIAP